MRIFLVSTGKHSEYVVRGLYSTADRAEAANRVFGEDNCIVEFEIDVTPENNHGSHSQEKSIFGLSTKEFAALNKVQPEAVRNQFYRHGEYFGVVPSRLLNGRLIWPILNVM